MLTGMYITCICVDPISIPILLPSSIRSRSCFIILYLMPYFIKNPTPLLPLIALSKFCPTHSYPAISISFCPFRCVSETAKISGCSSYRNCINLYFLLIFRLRLYVLFSLYYVHLSLFVVWWLWSILLVLFILYLFFLLFILYFSFLFILYYWFLLHPWFIV